VGGLTITGYVLGPTRVGAANSPYTQTPDIYVSDQVAFDAAYPSDESVPRTDYMVFVLTDGDFPDCTFCWTKNEVINRFDYDGREQRFSPLPGKALIEVGVLTLDSNIDRLSVAVPVSSDLVTYPVRISVGSGAGTTFLVSLVLNDGSFGSPVPGIVELSMGTGNLNWSSTDLSTYEGQDVRFQRQTFYSRTDSDGYLGIIGEVLLLNPLPATGQAPLVRIGNRSYLQPIEVLSFGIPSAGTVEWNKGTGELRFSSTDILAYPNAKIYYDGVVMAFAITVASSTLGTVASPGNMPLPLPPEECDLFFRAINPSFPNGFVQFQQTNYVDSLSLYGQQGIVEVRRSDGQVQFSLADRSAYGIGTAQYVLANLSIERGMTLRMFRTPVDLKGLDTDTLKDTSSNYSIEGAIWADPMISSPLVILPAIPTEDQPMTIEVTQGTGTFVAALPNLDIPSPIAGYGYMLNADERKLEYSRRRENVIFNLRGGCAI
jgi:hypothetical protein